MDVREGSCGQRLRRAPIGLGCVRQVLCKERRQGLRDKKRALKGFPQKTIFTTLKKRKDWYSNEKKGRSSFFQLALLDTFLLRGKGRGISWEVIHWESALFSRGGGAKSLSIWC